MIISIQNEGGGVTGLIPGLQPPDVNVDTQNPPPNAHQDALKALETKLNEVDLFSLPEPPGPGTAADYVTHTIRIQDGNRHRTFRVHSHNEPEILRDIRNLVRKVSGA
jgi:hypothetical protein